MRPVEKNQESNSWKVIGQEEIPFALVKNREVVKAAWDFLRLLHLRGMSARTLRAYAYDLLIFHRFLETFSIDPQRFNFDHLLQFLLSLRKENAAPRTINRRLTVVRSYLNYLEEGCGDRLLRSSKNSFYKGQRNKALLGPSRLKRMKRGLSVKVPTQLITPLSSPEIRQFLPGFKKYRDVAILYLMLFCGLRSCEVLGLQVDDIDFIDDSIRIHGKGGKERILPISPPVRRALRCYLDYERPEARHTFCFVSLKGRRRGRPLTSEGLRKLFRHQRKVSRLPRAHPHLFRHTFATHLIRERVSLPVVQKLMGHSDIAVTLGYVHMSPADVSQEYHQAIASLKDSLKLDENETSKKNPALP